ncbi:glycosyl hydrolase [Roseibium denhamense]|uniref:Beta-fructofuranosidase n=1 Tax=Roseibium denhamense TaxID=76305 RepID=A0ABY1PMB8_9HYPH|nr:glycosyl hydrolase [Roseibium denhamense]MTI05730.1 glycosyl hydrolase [Roseibium denhamense]SMP36955.1 beta-fructofuranosidase [Roseibium denhamense]
MYASHGFLRSDIGDVDVVYHDGMFHLFHLVLPNHDFIAHAVSPDAMSWRRVKNALFVGDPGDWDDDMLWTMHVSTDPERKGAWRMFYTGLARAEFGRVQRVGLARSRDLYHWDRSTSQTYPLEIPGPHYESSIHEGRHWVSFRDPFFFKDPETHERYLLSSARIKDGPIIRRGCVGLAREEAPDQFVFEAPLHRPGLYDDVEVPNLFKLGERYYLLGSIREDIKIHYWYADSFGGPYENFFDNVLLPSGNYAGRICETPDAILLFNFFSKTEYIYGREVVKKLLPPPKELVTDEAGRLKVKSYSAFNDLVTHREIITASYQCRLLYANPHASAIDRPDGLHLACRSGYEAFLLPGDHLDFRLKAQLMLEGSGKTGLVLRMNEDWDGYYLSLDLVNGIAQIRAWGANPTPEFEHAFRYQPLQEAHFRGSNQGPWQIEVVAHGMYLELSIDGFVVLSLVDDSFIEGGVGFYTESAAVCLKDLEIESLSRPVTEGAAERVYSTALPPLEDERFPPDG